MRPQEYTPQQIAVYFPGAARFQDSDGNPSGARGAVATVTISINLRPQWLTGIRVVNIYDIPTNLVTIDNLTYLDRLDDEQTMTTELTQSNIIVRAAAQRTITGRGGVHWHPLPQPYPWGGGNNITLTFTRLTAYPGGVFPTCHVTLEGIMLVKDTGAEGRAG